MKAKIVLLTAFLSAGSLAAAPLTETVAVRLSPSGATSAYSYLRAGTEPTLASMEVVRMTGPKKQWAKLSLKKPLVGYIQISSVPAPVATPAAVNAPATVNTPAPAVVPPPGPTPTSFEPGRPANMGDGGSGILPRFIEGKIAASRGFLGAKKPYELQLNDASGTRLAYLNLAKLLLTEQPDKYIDHTVAVFGVPHTLPDGKGLVIDVESLQLK